MRHSRHTSSIDMLNISKLRKTDKDATVTRIMISDIAFSLSGEIVYFVGYAAETIVSACDVSSGELITEKSILRAHYMLPYQRNRLVTVKEGVLVTTTSDTLELWNSELSQCVRNWTDINGITGMIPISEERVAREAKNHVIILDTTSGEMVSTIPTSDYERLLACNSKCQLLTCSFRSLQLSDSKTTLWRKKRFLGVSYGVFSLSEQCVLIFLPHFEKSYIFVLDAISGETLHILCEGSLYSGCKFIGDEECAISFRTFSGDYCPQLFNVKSGDLLSVLPLDSEANCLAACPRKRLLAFAQRDSKHGFTLIKVQLPQDEGIRKSKR